MLSAAMASETIFTLEATPVKFGPGAADDAGWELARLGVTRALLVTDPGVAAGAWVVRFLSGDLRSVDEIAAAVSALAESGADRVILNLTGARPGDVEGCEKTLRRIAADLAPT